MIEIYKEQVNDLIDLKNTNLNLIENKSKKLIIDNLTHVGVSSKEQLAKIINKGLSNRNSREYNYNTKSHFITMITIYHYYKNENYFKIGKLFLVDLEGSEKISKYEGIENLEEQKLINKSLIALSIIVQNLSNENDNITYAPYRDSKLTRIISDCIGGNAYTSLILNCSKHECSSVQTRSTLMFGEKVKKIKNRPIINIENFSICENGNDFEISFVKWKK
jgi:kinesin family protein 5